MVKSGKATGQDKVPNDKYFVEITVHSIEEAHELVRKRGLDLVHGQTHDHGALDDGDDKGRPPIGAYLNQGQIKELTTEGYELEVGDNVSEIGRERQKEVAKGDRFKGGKTPPKGMGVDRRAKVRGQE